MMIKALYIHIPFCKNICIYCDFAKMVASKNLKSKYIEALVEELDFYSDKYHDLETIYIGGGTPSILDLDSLRKILNQIKSLIDMKKIKEFTIEANPNDITLEFINILKEFNVNRISIGIQTTNNEALTLLKRTHNDLDIEKAINLLKNNNFYNINLDFIYSIPNQTLKDIEKDLEFIEQHDIPHISYYSLIIEDNTELKHLIAKSKIKAIDDDLAYEFSSYIRNRLIKLGYNHYETSNYAKSQYESKHNLIYWELKEYLGVGLKASSQYDNKRYKNIDGINLYIENAQKKIFNRIEEDFNPELEFLLMGLRKIKGISLSEFSERFNQEVFSVYPQLNKHLKNGLLIKEKDRLYFSEKGIDLANQVYLDLI